MSKRKKSQRRKVKYLTVNVDSNSPTISTASGDVEVRWSNTNQTTPMGQMVYFIDFLNKTERWDRWVNSCPLRYSSPNAPKIRDVLGTWFLSVIAGHKRYSHVTAIRCDGVNPSLLGMNKIISEDALRRGLKILDEVDGISWLDNQIKSSVISLLDAPWILDIDNTVKPLYGHQEGAIVGYNPTKKGRPSHNYHTYVMSGLRLVVGTEVRPGNESSSKYSLPGLMKILDELPELCKPKIVRGDCDYGCDSFMSELENRDQKYLFKLKQSINVKRHVNKLSLNREWQDAGQGWQGIEQGTLQLKSWNVARPVIVLRRAIYDNEIINDNKPVQLELPGMTKDIMFNGKRLTGYEYSVLITNLTYEILTLAQLYRDRGDAENIFDELKNQWGWGGYTTRDLHRCQLSARMVALVYNWWSIYIRMVNPNARKEAITSRPLFLSAVGERKVYAGKNIIKLSGLHANFEKAKTALNTLSSTLQAYCKKVAEQLYAITVWDLVCQQIKVIFSKSSETNNANLAIVPT